MKVETVESILNDIIGVPGFAGVRSFNEDDVKVYEIEVKQKSKGKIIGKNGQVIQALRTLLQISNNNEGQRVSVRVKEL